LCPRIAVGRKIAFMDPGAPPQTVAAGPPIPAVPRHEVAYDGRGRKLLGIVLLNTLLSILTLTVYRFWAKTRVREYLWSSVSFAGDRFEYFGRPRELLYGALIVIAVFAPAILLQGVFLELLGIEHPMGLLVVQGLYSLVLYWLFQFAVFRARRFRLTRTLWRGVRANQMGDSIIYAFMAVALTLLASFTAGLLLPLRNTTLYGYRINHTWLGNGHFQTDAGPGPLMGRWLLAWVFFLPTLGLVYFWYRAFEMRFYARRTRYGGLRFELAITGWKLFLVYWPYIPAFLLAGGVFVGIIMVLDYDIMMPGVQGLYYLLLIIILLTAWGIVRQLVLHRFARVFCRALSVYGEQDLNGLRQGPLPTSRYGEGLADALDIGGL
jgi:uncharacterized membrane protein YjgN (DUF898 family)